MHVINALAQSHEIIAKWSPLIKQTTGITENAKISWLAKYCHNTIYMNLNKC